MRGQRLVPFLLDHLIWFLLVAIVAFFALTTRNFLTSANFINILFNASVLGVLVIGQSFTLLTGNFDLSAESTLGLCGMLGIFFITQAGPPLYGSGLMLSPLVALLITHAIGLAIGCVQRCSHHQAEGEQLRGHAGDADHHPRRDAAGQQRADRLQRFAGLQLAGAGQGRAHPGAR